MLVASTKSAQCADGAGGTAADEITQAGEDWPVTDLYYVEPDKEAAPESADAEPENGSPVAATGPTGPAGRRFAPSFDLGLLLAALAVAVALAAGAIYLLLDGDDPAASTAPTEASPTVPPPETSTSPPPASAEVAVAEIEGMSLAAARGALDKQGLRVRVTRSPSERPRGEVLSQAPQAGSEVAKGTVVALVVSDGAGGGSNPATRVEVPDVVGLSASRAVSTLREAELDTRVRLVRSSERPGVVVRQEPAGGTDVAAGAVIVLEVAKARPTIQRVEVPDVVGSSAAAARRELRSAGFSVTTVPVAAEEPAGTVVEQSPSAGSELRKGGTVRLTVSTGPAKVDVPDVTGLDEAAATAELERAGFQVRVTDESTTDPAQDGVVIRQMPAGGSSAAEGTIVTITVARVD